MGLVAQLIHGHWAQLGLGVEAYAQGGRLGYSWSSPSCRRRRPWLSAAPSDPLLFAPRPTTSAAPPPRLGRPSPARLSPTGPSPLRLSTYAPSLYCPRSDFLLLTIPVMCSKGQEGHQGRRRRRRPQDQQRHHRSLPQARHR